MLIFFKCSPGMRPREVRVVNCFPAHTLFHEGRYANSPYLTLSPPSPSCLSKARIPKHLTIPRDKIGAVPIYVSDSAYSAWGPGKTCSNTYSGSYGMRHPHQSHAMHRSLLLSLLSTITRAARAHVWGSCPSNVHGGKKRDAGNGGLIVIITS